MPFLKPDDSVHKTISLERWQRRWLEAHPSIKLSTLIQLELINPLIEKKDPEYFKKYGPKTKDVIFYDEVSNGVPLNQVTPE